MIGAATSQFLGLRMCYIVLHTSDEYEQNHFMDTQKQLKKGISKPKAPKPPNQYPN